MPQSFPVDDDLVELVWRMAKPRPFETLTFSSALRRVLHRQTDRTTNEPRNTPADEFADAMERMGKKAPSPSATEWVATVPELRGKKGLNTWQAICAALKIDTAGDSARRKLKNWVKANRPGWPQVPDIDSA